MSRSQSALEYMMTYGWAILIIVIVAAVLYSFGIFSPSSSISATVTGFADTPVSAAVFTNNGGLAISLTDSTGYLINVTNITAITSAGTKTTILPNITISATGKTIILIPDVFTSSQQNSHISATLTITYKEPGQPLPGPYKDSGTISGPTPSVTLSSQESTLAAVSALTITNSQSTATPNPFQQMINITSSDPGWSYISTDFGKNVEFLYSNGTIIPSWLENYTSTHAIWWVKLGSIPASSSITIYMGFAPTSTNLFNSNNIGEAPQLSPTDAEYDDGANVFDIYFNGNTPTSDFVTGGGDTVTQETGIPFGSSTINAIRFTTGSSESVTTVDMYTPKSLPNNPNYYISEASFQSDGSGTDMDWGLVQNSGTATSDNAIFVGTQYGGEYFDQNYISNGARTNNINGQGTTTTSWRYSSLTYSSSSSYYSYIAPQLYSTAGGYSGTVSANPISSVTTLYWGWWGDVGASSHWTQFNWVRVRAYPPNGVMPSVNFGSVS